MFSTPEFNPIDRDILLENVLNDFDDPAARDSVRTVTQTYMLRRSINVTNMQKMRTRQRKPQLWDIENLNYTFLFGELQPQPIYRLQYPQKLPSIGRIQLHRTTENYRPFAKAVKGRSLLWIKDFNFYLMPQSLSLRTDVDRMFQETQLRNNSAGGVGISPTWNKNFTFNRFYNMRYDLSRSLKLEYDATMNTRIDEPFGRIDTEEKRDTVIRNFRNLGRPTRYHRA